MLERFTIARLEALLRLKPVSAAGRRFIDEALAAPSRNVQGTTKNVVSDIPCPKMSANAQAESWTAENPFTLQHIFDPRVVGYTNQAPRIEVAYQGKNGRAVRTTYTGDSLIFHDQRGVIVEEWKPASDREVLAEKYPGKYVRLPDGSFSSEPIQCVLEPMGIGFSLRFSDEVSSIGHRNRRFLLAYLYPAAQAAYGPKLSRLLEAFEHRTSMTLAELTESGFDADVVHWALAHRELHADLDAALLTPQKHLVQIFRHPEAMKAWGLAIRPDGGFPSTTAESSGIDALEPGDAFLFDGQRLKVSLHGATAVYAQTSNGQPVVITHDMLVSALQGGKVVLPDRLVKDANRSRLMRASPAELASAIRRIEILQTLDAGRLPPLQDRHSASTYRRWRRLVKVGEANGLSAVESLLDESDQRGFRGTHIDAEFSRKLDAWIERALRDKLNKTTLAMFYDIEELAVADGHRMVAKSSFYERVRRLRSVSTIRDAEGHKRAYPLLPAYWMLEVDTPVHCERAMELVHFDSTLLDVEIRSSISGEVLGRPWLSLAVCAHSRRVVGMYLSFRPPSYVSSMMLLADVIKRTGRLPDAIVHDWGSEFKAKDFKHALTALSITRHVRPKSAPRFGSVLERMFGVVTRELIDNVAGNTKARKEVRQLSPQSDPTTHSGLWLADLYQGLEDFFFRIYDSRKHSTILRAPKDAFDASFIAHGVRVHRLRNYDDLLSILMPTARGRPRLIDPARGVFVNYRYYGHPLMTSLALDGSSAIVKPIPFDPGVVLVFMKGQWLTCRAGLHADLQHAPEVVRRCLFEEWLLEQRFVTTSSDQARRELRALLDRLNAKALANKEYFHDRSAREILSPAAFPPLDFGPPSESLDKLNMLMKAAVATALGSPKLGQLMAAQ